VAGLAHIERSEPNGTRRGLHEPLLRNDFQRMLKDLIDDEFIAEQLRAQRLKWAVGSFSGVRGAVGRDQPDRALGIPPSTEKVESWLTTIRCGGPKSDLSVPAASRAGETSDRGSANPESRLREVTQARKDPHLEDERA